jgi:hypothetical protein
MVIKRSEGITPSEKYLKKLCDHAFLSLWSYPGLYRNQRSSEKSEGKELCDLLVIFQEHIIIFSDKYCNFPDTGDIELDWKRWFKRAVQKSANQIWGAERWIKNYPNRIFLDRQCKKSFPVEIPNPETTKLHRIVVVHDVAEGCKKALSSSGTLMIDSTLESDSHYETPFTIGHIDPSKGYVHVFDDISLYVILSTLDTITDFASYLTKKENFLCNQDTAVFAAGEDDLLGYYLRYLGDDGDHDFILPEENLNAVSISEGFWEDFIKSPERESQLRANQVSHAWDDLIETFNKYIMNDTQHYACPVGVKNQEKIVQILAREPRTRRRLLVNSLFELIEKTETSKLGVRVVLPSRPSDPHFVFLLLPHLGCLSTEEYREVRRDFLKAYCLVTKIKFPEAIGVVGIATETGISLYRSEDLIYYDAKNWTEEDKILAEGLQKDFGFLEKVERFESKVYEYPFAKANKLRRRLSRRKK